MFIDESENPDVPPYAPSSGPPPTLLPAVTGVIGQAVQSLRDGKSGFVLVHEKTQDGSINQTNAVFVKRVGEDIIITAWLGHEWGKPGTVGYGGSLTWEFD